LDINQRINMILSNYSTPYVPPQSPAITIPPAAFAVPGTPTVAEAETWVAANSPGTPVGQQFIYPGAGTAQEPDFVWSKSASPSSLTELEAPASTASGGNGWTTLGRLGYVNMLADAGGPITRHAGNIRIPGGTVKDGSLFQFISHGNWYNNSGASLNVQVMLHVSKANTFPYTDGVQLLQTASTPRAAHPTRKIPLPLRGYIAFRPSAFAPQIGTLQPHGFGDMQTGPSLSTGSINTGATVHYGPIFGDLPTGGHIFVAAPMGAINQYDWSTDKWVGISYLIQSAAPAAHFVDHEFWELQVSETPYAI
jgi:hypothetical protein